MSPGNGLSWKGQIQSWTPLASGGIQNPIYHTSVPLDYQSQPKEIFNKWDKHSIASNCFSDASFF